MWCFNRCCCSIEQIELKASRSLWDVCPDLEVKAFESTSRAKWAKGRDVLYDRCGESTEVEDSIVARSMVARTNSNTSFRLVFVAHLEHLSQTSHGLKRHASTIHTVVRSHIRPSQVCLKSH